MAEERRLRWLPEAVQDLERLDDFIREHSVPAADRFLSTVQKAAERLLTYPEIGRPFPFDHRFRELVIDFGRRGYVLRYRPDGEQIVVVRVWHALEDRT